MIWPWSQTRGFSPEAIGIRSYVKYDICASAGVGEPAQPHGPGLPPVVGIQLVVDASWFFADREQTVRVDNVRVNQHSLTARGFAP